MASKARTYGRGILRFTSWEPCRLPGQANNSNDAYIRQETAQKQCVENGSSNHVNAEKYGTSENTSSNAVPESPIAPIQNGNKPVKMLAKYNYKENPARTGGFDELTVTQGEKLEFIRAHPSNPYWWEARNNNGDVGFVPSTYMMIMEDKISTLPWLADKKQPEDEEEKRPEGKFGEPAFKPYVSAYGNNKNNSSENFYCDVCDKKLNGPIPYKMHLNSKAHKEEVALKEEFNR